MPDPYQNPPILPPIGGYNWVPPERPTGGAVPIGYKEWSCVRGQFRNDLPVQTGYSDGTLKATFSGTKTSPTGSENWPILAAFRPLSAPSADRGAPPSDPFVVTGAALKWQIDLVTPAVLSAITFTYSLAIDVISDDSIFEIIPKSSVDGQAILAYRSNPNAGLNVDWSKYKFAQVSGIDTAGKSTEYPTPGANNSYVQLGLTDFGPKGQGVAYIKATVTIRFGTGLNPPAGYPKLKSIVISNRYQTPSLTLSLYDILVFNALRTNVDSTQVPCSILAYAFPVNFNYDPTQGSVFFPNVRNGPNLHVKLFHPENRTGSPGFAHSISLVFSIFSMPVGSTTTDSILDGNTYFVVFIGPVPGLRTVIYDMVANPVSSSGGRLVPLDYIPMRGNCSSVSIQKSATPGTNLPADGSNWSNLSGSAYEIKNPPSFSKQGPYVSEFLFWDNAGTAKDWYRTIQTLADGTQYIGAAYRGYMYTEQTSLQLEDTSGAVDTNTASVLRRVSYSTDQDPMTASPVALFYSHNDPTPYANPIKINKGPWSLSLKAGGIDPNLYATSQLFARFWFVPENYDLDMANPHNYRNTTEVYFNTTSSGTQLVRGTPTNLSQLLVTPPLPGNEQYMELVRYVDGFAGGSALNLPFGTQRGRLVVGIYETSILTPDGSSAKINRQSINAPQYKFEIDPQYMTVNTTLTQILSYTLSPVRASNYTAASYAPYPLPLITTNILAGGDILAGNPATWQTYTNTFVAANNTSGSVAFSNLATLLPSTGNTQGLFLMPFTTIPNSRDLNSPIIADYVTNSASLMSGKVQAGRWHVALTFDRDLDVTQVACDYRIEAMLVTADGRVLERIFRSPIIPGMDTSSTTSIEYTTNIQFPFIISSDDQQLIIRLSAYPYSRSGQTINMPKLIADMKTANKPLGVRINSMTLDDCTLSLLVINQVASVLGSPAFYEDLPLVPPNSIENQQFWFIASPDLENTQIVSASNGLNVTGCLYSPSWFINLPANMEARCGAQGFTDNTLWFRTVPSGPTGTPDEIGVAAVQDPITHKIHIAHDETQNAASPSPTGKVIRHYILDHPYSPVFQNNIVAGMNGSATNQMEGKNPSLVFTPTTASRLGGGVLATVAQADENAAPSFNIAINAFGGEANRWGGPNRDLDDKTFGATLRRLSQGVYNPSVAISPNGVRAYVTGWTNPATIVLKETNLFDAGREGQNAAGTIYVVDGNPNVALGLNQTAVMPAGSLNGDAIETFPGLLVDNAGRITVAYTIQGSDGLLYARTFLGYGFSESYIIVNLRGLGAASSSNLAIFGPSMGFDPDLGRTICAFWAGGKIILTTISSFITGHGIIAGNLQLVAGNRNFTDASNPANSYFAAMQNSKTLRVEQAGSVENDVPKQRCGLYISKTWPHQGDIFVYYKDSDNHLRFRQVKIDSITNAPVVLS